MGKGENAGNQNCLLFPQFFLRFSLFKDAKSLDCVLWGKYRHLDDQIFGRSLTYDQCVHFSKRLRVNNAEIKVLQHNPDF